MNINFELCLGVETYRLIDGLGLDLNYTTGTSIGTKIYLIWMIYDARHFLAMALEDGHNLLSILVEDNSILVIST